MLVYWTKALCLYLLHVLFPQFLIFYMDSEAVMFDQILVDLPRVAQCPCVASATEYAGMHNAGWYCVYPTEICTMQEEPDMMSHLNLEAMVINHHGRLEDMKVDPRIVEKCCVTQ